MIKINLLGTDAVEDNTGNILIVSYFASLVVLLVACFIVYRFQASEVARLDNQYQDGKTKLAALKEKTKEVKDLEQKKAELRNITTAIGQLKLVQVGPVQALADVDAAIPAKLWLRSVKEKDGEVTLTGIAIDDFSVSILLKNLEESKFLKNIDLQESQSISLLQIVSFNAFESSMTNYIVPANEEQSITNGIAQEAKKAGLGVKKEAPRYLQNWREQSGANQSADRVGSQAGVNPSFGSAKQGEKIIGFGVRRGAKEPSIYVWTTPEGTQAKSFVVKAKIDYLRGKGEKKSTNSEKDGSSKTTKTGSRLISPEDRTSKVKRSEK